MTRFMRADTRADDPGRIPLSEAKLRALEPEVFSARTFKCSPMCDVDHPSEEMRQRIAEHLQHGDSRGALVVSVKPLVVAAYSDELDAVVLLRFPMSLVAEHRLYPGAQLLTVNSYRRLQGQPPNDELLFPVDILPGPRRGHAWTSFAPLIADFLTDDVERLEARKREIDQPEWERVREAANRRVAQLGLDTARSGKPTQHEHPHVLDSRGAYAPLGTRPVTDIGAPETPPLLWSLVKLVLLLAIITAITLAFTHVAFDWP